VDGWYAVQWVGVKIPRLALPITYEVSTSTSLAPWEHAFPQPAVITGRPLHACPRIATDQASFLVVYQLPENRTAVDLARHIACVAQVAPRRVTVAGHTATVGVESFIRMHQVHQALTSTTAMDIHVRRLLQEEGGGVIQRVGLLYINDTADPPVACPIGTYFSSNGTYLPLPPHSVAGPDCYGMSCIDGYGLLGDASCVPTTVPLDLVWVCVVVILCVIFLCSCIMCALHMGRNRKSLLARQDPPIRPVELTTTDSSFPDSTDPFVDGDFDDGKEFDDTFHRVYYDDLTRVVLDDMDDEFEARAAPSRYRVSNA
jgi:hypothetical protein